MTVYIDWGNHDETLLVWRFDRRWTENDYYKSHTRLQKLSQNKSYNVDIIIDLRRAMYNHPSKLMVIMRHLAQNRPANTSLFVFLTASALWERLIQIERSQSGSIWDFDYKFVRTVDKAYELVDHVQQTRKTINFPTYS